MEDAAPQQKGRVFPTAYKQPIGAFLSWPVGAESLSRALGEVPQAEVMEIWFSGGWRMPHQGKWPACFSVMEVDYRRYRNMHVTNAEAKPHWRVSVRPVPRELKPRVRAALESEGFACAAQWLNQNARISGREGRVTFVVIWNSDSGSLAYRTEGSAVPEVMTDAAARRGLFDETSAE